MSSLVCCHQQMLWRAGCCGAVVTVVTVVQFSYHQGRVDLLSTNHCCAGAGDGASPSLTLLLHSSSLHCQILQTARIQPGQNTSLSIKKQLNGLFLQNFEDPSPSKLYNGNTLIPTPTHHPPPTPLSPLPLDLASIDYILRQ